MKLIKSLTIFTMLLLTLFSCLEKQDNHALLVIDMQNDFCDIDGASLPVKGGTSVIPYINKLINSGKYEKVVFSQDWHPINHISFASNNGKNVYETITLEDGTQQTMWSNHCVPNTFGAEFHKDIDTSKTDYVVKKGTNPKVDSYSAFWDNNAESKTDLDDYLKKNDIKEVTIVGLALDYCVRFTCEDAIKLGYKVNLHLKGTKAVNIKPTDAEDTVKALKKIGVNIIE